MSEMARALGTVGAVGSSQTVWPSHYPNGRWGFVGSVPMDLSYTLPDGSPLPADLARKVKQMGAGLFRGQIKGVSFASLDEAIAAAVALGYAPTEDVQRLGLRKTA